jgi:hypothetical protein
MLYPLLELNLLRYLGLPHILILFAMNQVTVLLGFLSLNDSGSVIKLLHKGNDRDLITNWKPVSFVTIMYSLCSILVDEMLFFIIQIIGKMVLEYTQF